jgi:hypothetical protein
MNCYPKKPVSSTTPEPPLPITTHSTGEGSGVHLSNKHFKIIIFMNTTADDTGTIAHRSIYRKKILPATSVWSALSVDHVTSVSSSIIMILLHRQMKPYVTAFPFLTGCDNSDTALYRELHTYGITLPSQATYSNVIAVKRMPLLAPPPSPDCRVG